MKNGEHSNMNGVFNILSIKASMYIGLSDKATFPNIIPVLRPSVLDQTIKDPYWVARSVSGNGSFLARVRKSSLHKTGYSVELVFQITQHIKDKDLLTSFIEYFSCGIYRKKKA